MVLGLEIMLTALIGAAALVLAALPRVMRQHGLALLVGLLRPEPRRAGHLDSTYRRSSGRT